MKKTLLIFSCAFSLCFIGCASKSTPVPEESGIEAPEITEEATESQESAESEAENENQTSEAESEEETEEESADQTDGESETESAIEPEAEESEDLLEDIIEPTVITLDPPEEEVSEPEEDSETPEEMLTPEEVDLPADETESSTDETESTTEDDTVAPDNNDDVIDITDDDASASDIDAEMMVEEIVPSRKVTLKRFEYLDIVYPGNGWVFMGLLDGSKDLTYNGRKLGTGETKFTLQAKNAGTKVIHFYKEDNLTAETLDDYIEVEILDEKGSNKDHVTAPEYKLPLSQKAKEVIESNKKEIEAVEPEPQKTVEPAKTETKAETKTEPKVEIKTEVKQEVKTEAKTNSITTTPVIEKTSDPKLLLKEAQVLYNEKKYSESYNKLEDFFEVATTKRDEGLFLKGQILESKSDIQNIKDAIEAYTTLTKNYPSSKYWDDANKRIIYLKRFYLEVR